jgi:iron(III) transport system ATP-binding protein
MSKVQLINLKKRYSEVEALKQFTLEIQSGELFTLLGPSGCGKTTLLRTIAGFNRQDSGNIVIDGLEIDNLPAYRRDIGMVFQDYAIFPHMSVEDNIAFGLRNREVSGQEMKTRVSKALETVQLSGLEKRMPNELSGGQQQRVGLARSLVIQPKILLMDEPLSNLDAKLRIELREDIRQIQKNLGTTTIYVTHDQEEALVISDRICIMRSGQMVQVGTPWEIYNKPVDHFVASFVGNMIFLPWPLAGMKDQDLDKLREIESFSGLNIDVGGNDKYQIGIRPEEVVISKQNSELDSNAISLSGIVEKISFSGREAQLHVKLIDGNMIMANISSPDERFLEEVGKTVYLELPYKAVMFFEKDSGLRC